jgi:hypothetical protein
LSLNAGEGVIDRPAVDEAAQTAAVADRPGREAPLGGLQGRAARAAAHGGRAHHLHLLAGKEVPAGDASISPLPLTVAVSVKRPRKLLRTVKVRGGHRGPEFTAASKPAVMLAVTATPTAWVTGRWLGQAEGNRNPAWRCRGCWLP